ncbi:disease resistance protein RGA5-like [Triticum dicoccoides]|uniref:disease resistance protein RGA5-like n=1 Tax=Triticum dicoccoides TaxID=85692 RepID=UPI00189156DE|nr:disease resistance protein RGA5-like [Triticum dicoccoides]
MDFATGAMSSLLPKLGELLLEEYKLQKGLKKGIKDLRDELLMMQAALVKVSNVPLEDLDPVVKIWANDVRELSFAIEDSLDSFMVRVVGLEPTKPHTFLGFIKETKSKVTKLKLRREIANDIKDIKIQVKEVKERYDRYKDVISDASVATKVDPRLLTLYNKVSNLVGIDEAIDELTKRLSRSDDEAQQNLKTVSVVGFGGLGKTTLVKATYDNLKNEFDCGGFVIVGRNPDKKKVLRDILHELDKHKNITESKMDERQLIDQLQEFLKNKRYLIVIDDIWDVSTWEMIKCALVDSNSGSRIITTTRIHQVAEKVGGVYNIKPLSDDNFKKLFHSRIFGDKGISLDDYSDELSDNFFRKCGGVPLAIITLSSLLVRKPRGVWCKVFESIGFGHEDNEVIQNTRKILSFSYYDLPFHLKTCLLHLSGYPEDCLILKNWVIWKWVAEGFIPMDQEVCAFDLGQSYYNDLINRSMIQSIKLNCIQGIDCCRVHDIVLDLIRTLSREVNFITTQDKVHHNTSCSARRLAIYGGTVENMDVGNVRSFNAINFVDIVLPPLLTFKVLRVLVLQNCHFLVGGCHLEHLGKLVQLRYLGLMETPFTELPSDIGHHLKFLQTLNIQDTDINELPSSVGDLTNLMCLRASEGTRMMGSIGKLTSLEELELHHVDKSPDFTTEFGKLTQLRVLEINFDEMGESAHRALVKSLCNLRRMQTLEIRVEQDEAVQADGWEEWAPPSELRELALHDLELPRRPSWMDSSCLPHVSFIWLEVGELEPQDVQILGRMSSLRFLCLSNPIADTLSYTLCSHEFQNLTYLQTDMEIVRGEGALLVLEELDCYASVGKDIGLAGNMPFLKEVTYTLDCSDDLCDEELEATEAALRHAAETHPNRPKLKISRSNEESDDSDDDDDSDDGSEEVFSSDEEEAGDTFGCLLASAILLAVERKYYWAKFIHPGKN